MKFATVTKGFILGLALLLASSAFAATKGTLHLSDTTTVNGTTLKPGDYNLQWEGTGPSVDVNIMKGKMVIAKVTAKVVDLSAPAAYDAALISKGNLTGARFEGKKFALELGDSGDGMQAGSSK
jgi:hypothetical protein